MKNNCLFINDLKDIDNDIKESVIYCLDNLMTLEYDKYLLSVISGYNWYDELLENDSMIYISHIHEDEDYKMCVINDLQKIGFSKDNLEKNIRQKSGKFIPEINTFKIRNDKNEVYPGLRIKDMRINEYICLENYFKPLGQYPEFKDA